MAEPSSQPTTCATSSTEAGTTAKAGASAKASTTAQVLGLKEPCLNGHSENQRHGQCRERHGPHTPRRSPHETLKVK